MNVNILAWISVATACVAWVSIGFVLKWPALRRTMWPVWALHLLTAGFAIGSLAGSGAPLISIDTVIALMALSSFIVFLIVFMLALRIPQANGRPEIGKPLGEFQVVTEDGSKVSVRELLGHGPAMFVFFRGFWCLSCLDELRGLRRVSESLKAKGGGIIAISADKLEVLQLGKKNVPDTIFKVACDPGAEAIAALNLLQANMARVGKRISIPANILVDRHGIVRWTYYAGIVMDRPDPAHVLKKVEMLN